MKFQVGDKVLILHSEEEGEIVDIMDEKMLLVNVDGITFPVYADQVDFPYYKRFTEKKNTPPKEKQYIDDVKKEKPVKENKEVDGVWLNFIPVYATNEWGEDVVDKLKIYLINRTNHHFHFSYQLLFFGQPDLQLQNEIREFRDFYLQDIHFEDLNDNPAYQFVFSLATPEKKKAEKLKIQKKLKARQVFAQLQTLQENNQAGFLTLLFEKYPDAISDTVMVTPKISGVNRIYSLDDVKKQAPAAQYEIDLHIEKLIPDWKDLSNADILRIQLSTFEKNYDLAILHHQPYMFVIHGVGEGVLRDAIHERLRKKEEVKTFVNEYHPRYGFGATEINFQY